MARLPCAGPPPPPRPGRRSRSPSSRRHGRARRRPAAARAQLLEWSRPRRGRSERVEPRPDSVSLGFVRPVGAALEETALGDATVEGEDTPVGAGPGRVAPLAKSAIDAGTPVPASTLGSTRSQIHPLLRSVMLAHAMVESVKFRVDSSLGPAALQLVAGAHVHEARI